MAKTDVVAYANEDVGFYPTPPELAERMLENIDWMKTRTFLEPSAGKGNIVEEIMRTGYEARGGRWSRSDVEIDCIEIDRDLRSILDYQFIGGRYKELSSQLDSFRNLSYEARQEQSLKQEFYRLEKEVDILRETSVRIVADDFLKFNTYKQYDAIVMNPPFENGDLHLLHAIDLQKNGGAIVCLLNAETIRNPYTNTRKLLRTKLEKLGAKIEFIEDAFTGAERKTGVEVALIEIFIPRKERASFIFEGLKKAQEKKKEQRERTEVTSGDFIEQIIEQFNFEVEGTLRLIREYEAIKPYMLVTFEKENETPDAILTLSLSKDRTNYKQTVDINEYLKIVRLKYWRALFKNKQFTGALTSNLYEKYSNIVEQMGEYDFTLYNIQAFRAKMESELTKGLEDTILALFDKLSEQHSWYPECSGNIHYFSGWATNKAHMINLKKVIIPVHGAFAESWHERALNEYTVIGTMSDIEKVFNYLDTEQIGGPDLAEQINMYSRSGITKKIPLKYFWVTFYKKGTCHIEWRIPKLVEKLNIYGCQRKGWLPPCYGKKHYAEMEDAERAVVDEFQGAEEYEKVMASPDYYLTGSEQMLLTSGGGQ